MIIRFENSQIEVTFISNRNRNILSNNKTLNIDVLAVFKIAPGFKLLTEALENHQQRLPAILGSVCWCLATNPTSWYHSTYVSVSDCLGISFILVVSTTDASLRPDGCLKICWGLFLLNILEDSKHSNVLGRAEVHL